MRSTKAAATILAMLASTAAFAQMKVTQTQQAASGVVQTAPVAPPAAEASQDSARRIDRSEAMKLVKAKKAIYVDVRNKEQYDQGHVKGAMSIPLGDLMKRVKELPPGKMIITYCA